MLSVHINIYFEILSPQIVQYVNSSLNDFSSLFFSYARCVLEVPAVYRPATVLEIQHISPERCTGWGVRTERPPTITYTGWSIEHPRHEWRCPN